MENENRDIRSFLANGIKFAKTKNMIQPTGKLVARPLHTIAVDFHNGVWNWGTN